MTHRSPPLDAAQLAATGNRIEIRACGVTEIAGEKAKLQRQYFDMATMMQQLGVSA